MSHRKSRKELPVGVVIVGVPGLLDEPALLARDNLGPGDRLV
jgi:hypothetical protein